MRIDPETVIEKAKGVLSGVLEKITIPKPTKKIGLIVSVYIDSPERREYAEKTVQSLRESDLPENLTVVFIQDGGSEEFDDIEIPGIEVIKIKNENNLGSHGCLYKGFDYLFANNFDIFLNLDADALVKKDWLIRLLDLHEQFPNTVVSGFNTLAHEIEEAHNDYYTKRTIGGINMVFRWEIYLEFIREGIRAKSQWDFKVCEELTKKGRLLIVSRPSVIQHLGMKSTVTLGHDGAPDVAEDF